MRRHAAALTLLASLAACTSEDPVPPGALIGCRQAADCPGGLICNVNLGLCVDPDQLDTVPPDLTSLAATPLVGRAGTVFHVDVGASEPLAAAPEVTLSLDPPVTLPCTATGSLAWRCDYTAEGTERGGLGGVVSFDVSLRDLGGNRTRRSPAGSIDLDFRPPGVALASLALLPGPGNPLPHVTAAAAGTVVRLAVSADEPLAAGVEPSLAALRGQDRLDFTLVPGSLSANAAVFEATVPGGLPDGTYQPEVTWTDVAGNQATVGIADPAVEVKTSRPVLVVSQGLVTFVRSPWGAAAPEPLPGFTVPAGPFFGLAPADPLAGGDALPAAAFQREDGGPLVKVRVWADADRGTLLGELAPVAGGWERRALDRRDTPAAFVTGVDPAGNESAPPEQIRASEWVATANPPSLGATVHLVTATSAVSPALSQAPVAMSAAEASAAPGRVAAPDDDGATPGRSLAVASSPGWQAVTAGATVQPPARAAHRMVYDPVRRRVVLFGGSTVPGSSADALDDTWEWDGARWTQVTPLGSPPPRRSGHVLFFHPGRGTVVLFGGSGTFCLDDLWAWDGVRWSPIADPSPDRPINCGRGAAAWDAARGELVYWPGEVAEVWAWDGAAWTQRPGGGAGPTARRFVDMAFDPLRGAVVMYGGWSTDFTTVFEETWEWDGAWHLRNAASAPGRRYAARLAWDPSIGRVVLTGGRSAGGVFGDVWTWNGLDWDPVTPAGSGPVARADHAVAWDDVSGSLLVTGGLGQFQNLLPADTWWLVDGRWATLPAGAWPVARKNHAMAADPTSGGVLLFGGVKNNNPLNAADVLGDTWRFVDGAWSQASPAASPSPRVGHAMTPTPAGVALFGGAGPGASPAYLDDLWVWNGSTWILQPSPTGRPPARTGAGLAYDGARGRLVLFGGSNGSPLGDVWEHDGARWTPIAPAGQGPAPRAYHALVYDEGWQLVVAFGGCKNPQDAFARCASVASPGDVAANVFSDAWGWNGSGWSQVDAGSTAPRGSFAFTWAPAQRRMVVFGGYDGWDTLGSPEEFDGVWWPAAPASGAPATLSGAMAWDASSGRVLLFGGDSGRVSQEAWAWVAPPDRRPAVQLTVSTATAALDPAAVEQVRVRAVCGGVFAPYALGTAGAELWGWSTAGGRLGLGGWVPLAQGGGGWDVASQVLSAPGATRIEWASGTPAEARAMLLEAAQVTAVQCRPAGPAVDPALRGLLPEVPTGEAVVGADYLEVRILSRRP